MRPDISIGVQAQTHCIDGWLLQQIVCVRVCVYYTLFSKNLLYRWHMLKLIAFNFWILLNCFECMWQMIDCKD